MKCSGVKSCHLHQTILCGIVANWTSPFRSVTVICLDWTYCSYGNWLVDGGSRWFCDDIAWLRNRFFSKRNISVRIAVAFSTPRTGRQAPIFLTTISCGRLALQCHVQCKASLALELCPPACTADGIRPLWPTIHAVEKTFSRRSFYPRPLSIGLLSISD